MVDPAHSAEFSLFVDKEKQALLEEIDEAEGRFFYDPKPNVVVKDMVKLTGALQRYIDSRGEAKAAAFWNTRPYKERLARYMTEYPEVFPQYQQRAKKYSGTEAYKFFLQVSEQAPIEKANKAMDAKGLYGNTPEEILRNLSERGMSPEQVADNALAFVSSVSGDPSRYDTLIGLYKFKLNKVLRASSLEDVSNMHIIFSGTPMPSSVYDELLSMFNQAVRRFASTAHLNTAGLRGLGLWM